MHDCNAETIMLRSQILTCVGITHKDIPWSQNFMACMDPCNIIVHTATKFELKSCVALQANNLFLTSFQSILFLTIYHVPFVCTLKPEQPFLLGSLGLLLDKAEHYPGEHRPKAHTVVSLKPWKLWSSKEILWFNVTYHSHTTHDLKSVTQIGW